MLIITKDTEKLITIVEGTGDNLTDENGKERKAIIDELERG